LSSACGQKGVGKSYSLYLQISINNINYFNMNKNYKRGDKFREIILSTVNKSMQKKILRLIEGVKNAQKVDEHGNWDFHNDVNYDGVGEAINWDLYDYGYDFHSKKLLCVIQIRQYVKRRKSYFPQIRKNYYLIGTNEDKSYFAHPIESRVIHNAIKKEDSVIKAVQNWIFDTDYKSIYRQGDMGLINCKKPKGELLEESKVIFRESHLISADKIYVSLKTGSVSNDIYKEYYAFNPTMKHIPELHPEISSEGWCKVLVGKRTAYWNFSAPTID